MQSTDDSRGGLLDRATAKLTRRTLARSSGVIALGALAGKAGLLRSAAQESPSLREAINAAITIEAFATTFYGAARGQSANLELRDEIVRFARAAQCEEEAHFHFFEAAAAAPITTTFTIPSSRVRDQAAFLKAILDIETVMVGAHMALAREVASSGNLRLVEIAYQIGAVEAQHQALIRLFSGERIPSDRAYAKWLFRTVPEAVDAIAELGYIEGEGKEYEFPGPVDRFCRGVSGLVPETTEDQDAPQPPAGTPGATPVT